MFRRSRAALACALLVGVAGCAGGGQVQPSPLVPGGDTPAQQPAAVAHAAPDVPAARSLALEFPSSGVKTKTEKISPNGGKLSLPGLPSLKGSFGYPSNNANSGSDAVLSASLTNAFDAPIPSGANIVYFLQATLKSSEFFITFNPGSEKVKVSGSLLNPGDSYTVYVYVPSISNQPLDTISAGQPSAKHVLEFSSPLNSVTLPTNTAVILELGQD